MINIVTALDEADDALAEDKPKPAWRPSWYLIAKRYVGHVSEVAGKVHNEVISNMWKSIGWRPQPDEVPWCAVFVNFCLDVAGYAGTDSPRARSFEEYGEELIVDDIQIGDIVVLKRGKNPALGHVTFFEGWCEEAINSNFPRFFLGLGGNQRDSVCVSRYSAKDIVTIRRPTKGDSDG